MNDLFIARNSFRSMMLEGRAGKHTRGLKTAESRMVRHSHRAALTKVDLKEIREEFGMLSFSPTPSQREQVLKLETPFQPSFLLADAPPPSRVITVLVKRKSTMRRARTEMLQVAV